MLGSSIFKPKSQGGVMFSSTHGLIGFLLASRECERLKKQGIDVKYKTLIVANLLGGLGGTIGDWLLLYNIFTNIASGRHALAAKTPWMFSYGDISHSFIVLGFAWAMYAILKNYMREINKAHTRIFLHSAFFHSFVDLLTHKGMCKSYFWPLDLWWPKINCFVEKFVWLDYHPVKGSYLPRWWELVTMIVMTIWWAVITFRIIQRTSVSRRLKRLINQQTRQIFPSKVCHILFEDLTEVRFMLKLL